MSHAAAEVALEAVGDAPTARALVVGTGEAAELATHALRHRGVRHLVVTGRTAAHADAVARRTDATVLPWTELRAGVATADLVVSATAAPDR